MLIGSFLMFMCLHVHPKSIPGKRWAGSRPGVNRGLSLYLLFPLLVCYHQSEHWRPLRLLGGSNYHKHDQRRDPYHWYKNHKDQGVNSNMVPSLWWRKGKQIDKKNKVIFLWGHKVLSFWKTQLSTSGCFQLSIMWPTTAIMWLGELGRPREATLRPALVEERKDWRKRKY